jgi:hypothetical protein
MSDPYNPAPQGPVGGGGPEGPTATGPVVRQPFPWLHLLYAILFGVLGWIMFWLIVILLAPLQFITIAITGRPNDELRQISMRAIHYLAELMEFVTVTREETPFPLGPFPKD